MQAVQDENVPPSGRQIQYRLMQDSKPRADLKTMIGGGRLRDDRHRLCLGSGEEAPFPSFSPQFVYAEIDGGTRQERID